MIAKLKAREMLGDFLLYFGLDQIGVEVGVFKGEFAEQILERWTGRLILVDTWRWMPNYFDSWNFCNADAEVNFEEAQRRLARFGNRVEFCRLESGEAAAAFRNDGLDFVYIDANHAFSAVHRDLALWFPKVRYGGLVCGHDYFDARADDKLEPDMMTRGATIPTDQLTSYGVKSAVDSFAVHHGYEVHQTDETLPTWYFFKRYD